MRGIALVGSTGQIGTRVLDVVRAVPGFRIDSLTAHTSWEKALAQVREFQPRVAVLLDPEAAERLSRSDGLGRTRVESGREAMLRAVEDPGATVVVSAAAGAAGLAASHRAVVKGKTLALANKESVVMAGGLLMREAARTGASIIPVDSEHSAIFQCLRSGRPAEVRRLIVTASGGPFRKASAAEIENATPEQALRHPIWKMGPKITIDSATLMNKALEIIEARHLFGVEPDQIEVVIHPESIIHSMVEFRDGSVLAQMSLPDMRLPIQYALTYPDRAQDGALPPLDLARIGKLTFERPDPEKFPALGFGFRAARMGGTSGACLNGADEAAIEEFLAGRIRFPEIARLVGRAMDSHRLVQDPTMEEILSADAWARDLVRGSLIGPKAGRSG